MGLDMFLYKKTYIGNKWKKPNEQVRIEVKGVLQKRVSSISEEVGYWRKANAIHQWFVENCQDGDDNCQETYVDNDKLKELLKVVSKVIKASKLVKGQVINGYTFKDGKEEPIIQDGKFIEDHKVAERLLPVQSGFFFGGKSYDQWYYDDLVYTQKLLKKLLKDEFGDYYYDSSW